jgi:hypothetical protein
MKFQVIYYAWLTRRYRFRISLMRIRRRADKDCRRLKVEAINGEQFLTR